MRLKHHPDSPFSSTFISLPAYMTDWDDPAVILSEYCSSFLYAKVLSSGTYLYASVGYVNIVHVMFGIYM
jgi:hypothetical protein